MTRAVNVLFVSTAWLTAAVALLCANSADAAGIVPDGATATSVSTAANGRQTVTLAPAVYGVSQNTYSNFNVTNAGATLNNTGINARTIVNQVTSTNPSLIQGDITVSGPRANVILANPNGITIDGGSFVNTGHVALSTGQVSFDDIEIAPGSYQRNVILTTTGGTLTVGPGGLAGALINLDLIAKNVAIDGPVTNSFTESNYGVRVVAGSSTATVNTFYSPSDNGDDWISYASGNASANGIALDISNAGSLTGGKIQLIVTDQGAGVHDAGALNANGGDFTLSANGNVEFDNTTVNAVGNISMSTTGSLTFQGSQLNANDATASLTAGGSILLAGSSLIANEGISTSSDGLTLQNSSATESTIASANSGVVLTSSGDIDNIDSLIQGNTRISGNAQSLGAVTLNASGNILNQSSAGSALGILFGQNDDVSLTAGGTITNLNARILSNNQVVINATGDLDNLIDYQPGSTNGQVVGSSGEVWRFLVFSRHDDSMYVDYGNLPDPTQLAYITAGTGDNTNAANGSVRITANHVNNLGGTIQSTNGDVDITAQQSLTNQAYFTGQMYYSQSCFIVCSSHASSDITPYGGQIQAGGAINLAAGTVAQNIGGNVLAFGGDLTVTAPLTIAQGMLDYTVYNRDQGMKAFFGNDWAAIYANDSGGLFEASGDVTLNGQGEIDGGEFLGGTGVTASGGIITIQAPRTTPVTIGNHLGLPSWLGL
jgi:filamentous hemagglutinin family protein